jgi:hypothetical protein
LGERLDDLDAGLSAAFDIADGTRAQLGLPSKLCFIDLPLEAHRLQTRAQVVSVCHCAAESRAPMWLTLRGPTTPQTRSLPPRNPAGSDAASGLRFGLMLPRWRPTQR